VSVANSLTELVARRKAAAAATARQTVAECVKKQALGRPFTDGELDGLRDALAALDLPPETVDETAELYARYPALRKAVADLPTDEQMAATKKALIDELVTAEGRAVVAQRFGIGAGEISADATHALTALRVRVTTFGQAEEHLRRQFRDAAARLAPTFALVGEPPEPKPAAEENATTGKKKATAAK
jgi:hypothetical protein